MASKISPEATIHFVAIKRNKNSIVYSKEGLTSSSGLIPNQIKAMKLSFSSGVDVYLRNAKNWNHCSRFYFPQTKVKGIYKGGVVVDGVKRFVILKFSEDDQRATARIYPPGFYPNMRYLAQMVVRLDD